MKKSTKASSPAREFTRLVNIMARLRGPHGCPWDKHQDHATLLKYLFSEAREVKEAVHNRDWKNLQEELGDVLLQVVFHAQVAAEKGRFSIADVVRGINEKLTRRHPHVFGGTRKLSSPQEVHRQWEEIKKLEKKSKKR